MQKIKLPIPLIYNDLKITDAEINKPKTKTLKDTKRASKTRNFFLALKTFLTSTVKLTEDKEKSDRLITELPQRTAELIALKVLLLQFPEDDKVEGIYTCPRCRNQIICEFNDGFDNRDSISELNINYFDKDQLEFTSELNVIIKDKKSNNVILDIKNITMRFPLLKDFIEVVSFIGNDDPYEIQNKVFEKCIIKLNNTEFTKKERNLYATKIIDESDPDELEAFSSYFNSFGLIEYVNKVCLNCGKKFKTKLNTANFFDSALD